MTANIRRSVVRVLFGCFAVLLSAGALAAPCIQGSLQSFADLGATGCEVGSVQFTDFTILPGQTVGTQIDPSAVQVTPGGTDSNPTLLFTVSTAAAAGEVFELFVGFTASDTLMGASLGLTPPTVTGDGAATGILDLCPNGSFAGGDPLACSTTGLSLLVFGIDESSLLADSTDFPSSGVLGVLLDLTIDGGADGTAALDSVTVGFSSGPASSVPEPSAILLVALGLLMLGVSRVYRRARGTERHVERTGRSCFVRAVSKRPLLSLPSINVSDGLRSFLARVTLRNSRSRYSFGPALPGFAVVGLAIGALPQSAFGQQLPWMNPALTPEVRAELLLRAMTLEEKISQLSTNPSPNTDLPGCEFQRLGRHVEPIPRLAIPTYRQVNGGNGIRGGDCLPEPTATGLPSGTLGAATFNPDIIFQWGQLLGQETRDFAHHVLLGPGLNLIRAPYTGRAQEYMSEDPFLAGVITTQMTRGIQAAGVTHAMIKHFVANDDEGGDWERWTKAVRAPSRALHELYLLPFEMAVRDGDAASIMCAFPHLNFEWACENHELMIRTLRHRWNFDGYVESDRRAMHSTVPSILAQTSIELDTEPDFYTQSAITAAINAGEITESDIDKLLRTRYTKMFEFGHFDTPYNQFLPTDYAAGNAVARQAAIEGVVLLKNEGDFLPLGPSVQSIALIGAHWFAGEATLPPRNGNPAEIATVIPPQQFTVSPAQGLANTLAEIGSNATVTYNNGADIASAVALAQQSDITIVMVGTTPRETRDIETLSLPVVPAGDPPEDECDPSMEECPETPPGPLVTDQEALVPALLAANPNTIVVLKTGGMILMPWLDNARAVLQAWFPGQNDGDAVADILFGIVNPSGKLPVTFGNTAREAAYETEEQYPGVHEDTGIPGGQGPDGTPGEPQLVARYTEDLEMGYRWYEANGVEPVFPFGFGLSYTTFGYSNLSVTPNVDALTGRAVLDVSYTITNTGSRAGAEASQVYVSLPPVANEPSKRLVGFEKIELAPGESQTVTVTIDSAASNHPLSYFEPDPNGTWADGNWITPSGTYTIHVGGSSADTPLETTVNLDVVEPPFRLRIVSGTIDLRGTAPRRVQAVLSLPPPYSLSNMQIMDVRFEGTPALSTALSSDGRALMATFDGRDLKRLTAGQNVTVSLAADILRGGTPDKLWVSTTATVLRSEPAP